MSEREVRPQENKMGVLPIPKLLVSMSVPIMISMLVQALYNVVDSYFVAKISENAFNAVSLAFPVQNLMISVAVGTGVGINALLSKSLGEKDFRRANLTAANGVFLAMCSTVVFALLCGLLARPFFAVQTDVAEIVEGGTSYIFICGVFSFGLFLEVTFERLLQSTGRTMLSMVTQLIGAVINIVLDPICIFTLDMGVAGAAVATVLGQIVGGVVAVVLNKTRNPELQLTWKGFRPDGGVIRGIYSVGVPSIIMSSISSVMTFGLNQILLAFTTTATAVFGAYFKIQSFFFMPVFGLNNGMVPIVAYNFGARKPERMTQTVKLGVALATAIMVVGMLVFLLAPQVLLGLFDPTEQMLQIGKPAFRIISLSFLLAGFDIVASSTFQALGHGVLSLIISLVRQLVVLLPAAWLLSLSGSLSAVWWSYPIAELFSFALCILFLRYVYRREIDPMRAPDEKADE